MVENWTALLRSFLGQEISMGTALPPYQTACLRQVFDVVTSGLMKVQDCLKLRSLWGV